MCRVLIVHFNCGHYGRVAAIHCGLRHLLDQPCADALEQHLHEPERCFLCSFLDWFRRVDMYDWARICRREGRELDFSSIEYTWFRVRRRREVWNPIMAMYLWGVFQVLQLYYHRAVRPCELLRA
ncbi:hypothetical protein VTN96DRAFT_6978 [Rasamsonia emersonii]